MIVYTIFSEEERQCLSPEIPHLYYVNEGDYTEGHSHLLHEHKEIFEILLIQYGQCIYTLGQNRYSVKSGDVILCNCSTVHEEFLLTGMPYKTLCIGITNLQMPDLPPNHLVAEDQCPVFRQPEQYQELAWLMERIMLQTRDPRPFHKELCQNLMLSCLSLVQQMIAERIPQTELDGTSLCSQVEQYIGEHYMTELTLAQLGKLFHVSPYHLAHLFKRETGYTLKQYILRRRIGEAQTLLTNTQIGIGMIAQTVGFENSSHFGKLFTKYVGMSPTEYRSSRTRQEN